VTFRLPTGRIAAALLSAVIGAAPLAFAGATSSTCAAMICCRGGKGAVCPMHAPSSRTSFRTCSSDADVVPPAPQVTLSLPVRVGASIQRHPSGTLRDLVPARELRRPTDPGVPPPERLA
jgi:hypothetical protein